MRRHPKDSAESVRRVTRRGLILGGAQLVFMGVLGLRMRYMQVDQADQFRVLAEENRISIRLIAPARGQIFDRNGAVIAENQPSYRIIMVREDAGDIDLVMHRLAKLIDLSEADQERALKEMRDSRGDTQVTVADRVSWDDISKVAINAPALPGVTPEVGLSRAYPTGPDFAHVVGYVGPISDYDLQRIENPDHLLRIPRFQIGKVGLEARHEDVLRGKAGTKRVEVNAAGRVMRELDRQEGKAGANMQLTVDNALQSYVQARMAGESAAAVVMDCDTGDLLAIASAPSFDPNLFVRGISVADYSSLTENKYRPLANKSVQGLYPPGSTYKMVTVLAALDAGVISPEETVWCPGHMDVSGRRFHCWKRGGHGHMNLETALRESCDVYYYDLALKVGIDAMSAMAEKLGIGVRFDLPMSAVARGRAPTRDWKRETIRADHGWWATPSTPRSVRALCWPRRLQLAVMTARLAVGRKVEPRLVRSIDGVEQPPAPAEPLGFNENHLRAIRKAMFEVTNNRRGTAYGSRIITDGYRMAGKTGTSQVRNITAAERARGVIRNEDLPWERRDHALFVNYAPYDNPRIAVSVVVEHGGGGSAVAAPIARDITLQALYRGDPPLDAYPEGDRARIQALQERLRRERPVVTRPAQDRA
jgi:penicillin-binding protein 2